MSAQSLFGIMEFSQPISCAADALGETICVVIGGVEGTITLPSLPEWHEGINDPLRMPLVAPAKAQTWKRDGKPIYWGSPISYPTGRSSVNLALFEFSVSNVDGADAQNIYDGFSNWLDLFERYVILLTTQHTRQIVTTDEGPGSIELLYNDEHGNLKHVFRHSTTTIGIIEYGIDDSMHLHHFKEAAQLSSENFEPRLEYSLLLEAYNARGNGDFRKAIIEAATALEICLTNRILDEFTSQGVSFGKQLMRKFRMLGGRFELARIVNLPLPNKDYEKLIVGPRNEVMHRAEFPSRKTTDKLIAEVEELLRLFSPSLHQG